MNKLVKGIFIFIIIFSLFSSEISIFMSKAVQTDQIGLNNDDWKKNSILIDNINNSRIISVNSIQYNTLSTVDTANTGIIIYKFNSPKNEEYTSFIINYTGRALSNSYVEFYISTNNVNYNLVSRISRSDTLPTGDGDGNLNRQLNLSSAAGYKRVIFVKIVIKSTYDSWGCIKSLQFDSTTRQIAPLSYTVFSPDFSDNIWREPKLVATDGISNKTINSEYTLTSKNPGFTGNIIYKLDAGSKRVFSDVLISYRARAIRNSYVKFYISNNGDSYQLLETLITPSGIYPDNDPGINGTGDIDLLHNITVPADIYNLADSIYVKIEIHSVSDTWASLKKLYVSTLTTEKAINTSRSNILRIGNAESEQEHNLVISGNISKEVIQSAIGTVKSNYQTITFNKENDTAVFRMDISNMTTTDETVPVLLEMTEVHRAGMAFGYKVFINDIPVYFRTYEPLMTAPNIYFISFNRSIIGQSTSFTVKIVNFSNSPFSLARVRSFGDFYRLAKEEGYYDTKMGINEYVEASVTKAQSVSAKYPFNKNFYTGVMFGLAYISTNYSVAQSNIRSYLDFSRKYNMPVHIMQSRWWGHTAYSPDGLGGYFGDLKYSQIIYDPVTGAYKPTTPNQWGDTMWPTMSNPVSNNASTEKLINNAGTISNELALLQASDNTAISPVSLIMEWGDGYWNGGDFSNETISLAKNDGIILNPEDGLSFDERLWLVKNCADYNTALAKSYKKGLGPNAVTVSQGIITYPDYQLSDNIFSHVSQSELYPSNDNKIPLWTSGVTDYNSPSSEMYSFTDQRHLEYSRSFGKLSCANLEMTMLTQNSFENYLKECFANGMEFITMFNSDSFTGEEQALANLTDIDSNIAPAPKAYNRAIFDLNYQRDYRNDITSNPQNTNVYSYSNISASQNGYIQKTSSSSSGEVIYKFTDTGKFSSGLELYLQAKTSGTATIGVYAGSSTASMSQITTFKMGNPVNWFNNNSENIINLSGIAAGKDNLFVKLVLSAGAVESSSVRAVRALLPWGEASGNTDGYLPTMKETRAQNVFIQYEDVAKKALSDYLEKSNSDARVYNTAYDYYLIGRYNDCIKLLTKSASELLPAKYAIEGYGSLGIYPVNVSLQTGEPAIVTLESFSDGQMIFSLYSENPQEISFALNNTGGNYKLEKLQSNKYSLTKTLLSGQDIITSNNGKAEFSVMIEAAKKSLPSFIEGIYKGRTATEINIQTQDPSVGEYADYVSIPYTSSCVFQRKQYNSSNVTAAYPQAGDKVSLTLNSQNQITAVLSEFGTYTGKIIAFSPPKIQGTHRTNGYISFDNGQTFEISFNKDYTLFDTSVLNGLACAMDLSDIEKGIVIGATATVLYTPYSYNGSIMRIMRLTQPYSILLDENYESSDWASYAESVSNLSVQNLDSNHADKVLAPTVTGSPGSIVYKFTTSTGFKDVRILYSGRAIINSKCKVSFYFSYDNIDYSKIDELNWLNYSNDARKMDFIDISSFTNDKTAFYIRVDISSTYQTWACLNSLRVVNTAKSKPDVTFGNYKMINRLITDISPETTVSQFLSRLGISNDPVITIKDFNGKIITGTDKIGTGSTVSVTSNDNTVGYNTLIYGDINGDGTVDVLDLIKFRNVMLGKTQLNGYFVNAAQVNQASQLSITSLLTFKDQIISNIPINQDPE